MIRRDTEIEMKKPRDATMTERSSLSQSNHDLFRIRICAVSTAVTRSFAMSVFLLLR